MNVHDSDRFDEVAGPTPAHRWSAALQKFVIWGMFFLVLYLARDFFFVAFMTFLFSYITLGAVGWGMQRLSPARDKPWLRRTMTVAMLILMPGVMILFGRFVAPPLFEQGYRLAGWLNQASAEAEVSRLLEKVVGPSEFHKALGGPGDARYQKELEIFRATGIRHVQAYHDFPHLEAWVEGGFSHRFTDAERGRIRQRLLREGTSNPAFEKWFIAQKAPQLAEQAKRLAADGTTSATMPPLVRAARDHNPEQLLDLVRRDPAALGALRLEWVQEATETELVQVKKSPAYLEQFRVDYEEQKAKSPASIPYTFEQFFELRKARAQGRQAFGAALDRLVTGAKEDEATFQADFEAAKQHELFQAWWGASPTAKVIRNQLEISFSGDSGGRVHDLLLGLLNIPLDLGTALLLGFFICIDFPHLRSGFVRLRQTALKDVYDEIVPRLANLGHLIGCSMRAQGTIALCNAILMFLALTLLGVEHAVLLGLAVFVLCLVPTLGILIAWALIAAFALVQPGGGPGLAAKASVAIVCVLFIETFVLSPRILGRLLDLHPVLVITVLPIAQYFFGIKGLILAVPVTVFLIQVIILQRGEPAPNEASATPVSSVSDRSDQPARSSDTEPHREQNLLRSTC